MLVLWYYIVGFYLVFFFFKQKTAYEMRISDWSSDVCSSDLFLPKEDVHHLDLTIEEGIKLVISGGIVVPDQAHFHEAGSAEAVKAWAEARAERLAGTQAQPQKDGAPAIDKAEAAAPAAEIGRAHV